MVQRLKISSISPKEKIFLVHTFSLSPLCPRTSKRLSIGEEVGIMQFKVQRGENKEKESIKRKRKKYEKRKI
jgi:hypothetical protein